MSRNSRSQLDLTDVLPDRNHTDIPPQVQWFLSVCEVAVGWYEYQARHFDEPQECFCRGVVDYWWDDGLEEPRWEQLFYTPLRDEPWEGWPSYKRFCYQQGAIVGYQLREEYGEPRTAR